MTQPKIASKPALEREIARKKWQVSLWTSMRAFAHDDHWKAACKQLTAIRDQAVNALKSGSMPLEKVRFTQGQIDILDYLLDFQNQPEEQLQVYQSALDDLQKQMESFDTVARAEGRDPEIHDVIRGLRDDHNQR